jgi:RNA polymerase sigma-70 factor (ECF subfamily)
MSDEIVNKLARAFSDGDVESYRFLVESLTRPLMAMAYRYTKDWEIARDLTQETWIRVYERIDRYDPGRAFRNWLYTVHRNGCLNHLRSAAVRFEVAGIEQLESPDPGINRSTNPSRSLEHIEFMQRLQRAMDKLSERERSVFSLVDIEHNGQAEAAVSLGMNPTTLRTTLHHARKKLAGILRKMEEMT